MTFDLKFLLFRALLGVCLIVSASGAFSQELLTKQTGIAEANTETEAAIFTQNRDWVLQCTPEEDDVPAQCRMSTFGNLALTTPPQQIAMTGVFGGERTGSVFYLTLPLGLMLTKGAQLSVDGRTLGRLAYRSCHTDGCIVPFSLGSGIGRRFRQGTNAKLTVTDLSGKTHDIEFSLMGFSHILAEAQDLSR